jgi:hypothetical protein
MCLVPLVHVVSEWALSGTSVSVRLAMENWCPGLFGAGRMQNEEEQRRCFAFAETIGEMRKGFPAQPGPPSVDLRRAVNQASTSAQWCPGIPPSARLVMSLLGGVLPSALV